jgi:hypothetical protein
LTTIGRIQATINVLQDDSGLIVAALVDIRGFVVFAVVESAGAGLLRHDERVTGAERRLIEKIAAIGITEVVAIKLGGSVSRGFGHKGIIVAVEKIDLLPAEVFNGIDVASRRFGVCLRNESAHIQVGRRSFHA